MSDPQNLLEAGGILPKNAKVKGKELDVLEARTYAHPGLPTPLVRLSPASVAHGVDLEMELLGFETPKKGTPLGQVKREKLGFPAWALVHDEKNARYALDVLEDLKKAIRKIKSKPGTAKELIDGIAETLAGSVPHFLPSFYEEAAQAFIEHDNRTYGQQYFEKARAAERNYALEVDDDLREQSFVDFALAGALSVKSLSNFANELESRGKDGLESYLRVCIRRTTGGLPPSPAMLKDLKSLAKAAGEKPDDAHVRFVDAILESPVLAGASAGFFKGAKKAFRTIAKADAEKRKLILDLFPRTVKMPQWLPVLKSCGALDALPDADAEGQSELSVAAWLSKAISRGVDPALLELLEKCAPRLKAEGEALFPKRSWRDLDIDATELALRLEIPVTHKRKSRGDDGEDVLRFDDVDDWASAGHGADLEAIAASEVFRPLFVEAVSRTAAWHWGGVLQGLDGRPKLDEMAEEGLGLRLAKMKAGGLADLSEEQSFLSGLPDSLWSRYAGLGEAAKSLDVAASLARTFRIGHTDELRWARYEELAEGKLKSKNGVQVFHTLPYVALHNDKRVVVLDGEGNEVFDHKAKLDKGESVQCAIWVEDDLLVFVGQWSANAGYWASAPKERFSHSGWIQTRGGIRLEDGSVIAGQSRIRKGDRTIAIGGSALCDGERWYRWRDGAWESFDPMTGEPKGKMIPPFLKKDDDSWYAGYFRPLEIPEGAPLRGKDGLIGVRWYEPEADDEDTSRHVVDDLLGRVAAYDGWRSPKAVATMPGGDAPIVFVDAYGGDESFDREGVKGMDSEDPWQHGTTKLFSMSLLTRYRPRELETSKALRAIGSDQVRGVVEAAATKTARKVDLGKEPLKADAEVVAALEAALPTLKDESLTRALAGVAHFAGQLQEQHRELLAKVPEGGVTKRSAAAAKRVQKKVGDPELPIALGSGMAWAFPHGAGDPKKPTMLSEVAELRARFDSPGGSEKQVIKWGPHIWQLGLGHGAGYLYRYCCVPKKKPEHRTAIAEWVRELVAQGFEADDEAGRGASKIRIDFRKTNTKKINQSSWERTWTAIGDNAIFVWQLGYGDDAWYTFVEHAPSGEFEIVKDPKTDLSGPGWATVERIDEVVAKVGADGPLPIEAAVPLLSDKTGMSPAEATLWALAELESDTWKRAKKGRNAAMKMWEHNPFRQPYPTHMSKVIGIASRVWTAGDWNELWDPEVLAERLAEEFLSHQEELPPLTKEDDVVLDPLSKQNAHISWVARSGLPGAKIELPALHQNKERYFDKDGYQEKGEGFSDPDRFIRPLMEALYEAPGTSAIVQSLPSVWRAVRERLSHESFFHEESAPHPLPHDDDNFYAETKEELAEEKRVASAFYEQFQGALPAKLWRGKKPKVGKNPFVVPVGKDGVYVFGDGYSGDVFASTAAILGDDPRLAECDIARLRAELRLIMGDAGDRFIALAEKVAGDEGSAGDPRLSAPKTVAAAAKKLGVSEDAAAYYLMLVALPHPADRRVQSVCGWTKKAREKGGAELVAKDLVLEAKRAGAGRSLFIPGAWVKGGGVGRPVEDWKRPHLGWTEESLWGLPFRGEQIMVAPDVLYETVWKRIDGGDAPAFEDPPKRKKKAAKK